MILLLTPRWAGPSALWCLFHMDEPTQGRRLGALLHQGVSEAFWVGKGN